MPPPYERPFRLRVLDALTATLKTIHPDNDYTVNLSDYTQDGKTLSRVLRGRLWYGADDPLPMVSILEPPLPVDQMASPLGSTASKGEWDLLIQGWVPDDHLNPTDPAYVLAAEVRSALMRERGEGSNFNIWDMGSGESIVEDLTVGAPVVRPGDEVSDKACFWLPLTIKVVEDAAEPYA